MHGYGLTELYDKLINYCKDRQIVLPTPPNKIYIKLPKMFCTYIKINGNITNKVKHNEGGVPTEKIYIR